MAKPQLRFLYFFKSENFVYRLKISSYFRATGKLPYNEVR